MKNMFGFFTEKDEHDDGVERIAEIPIRVFISLPMNGREQNEIESEMYRIKSVVLRFLNDNEIKFERTCWSDIFSTVKNEALAWLGFSINAISRSDIVVFAEGWEKARGCRIEHDCCKEYGVQTMYMKGDSIIGE